jgi:hypothetical protein
MTMHPRTSLALLAPAVALAAILAACSGGPATGADRSQESAPVATGSEAVAPGPEAAAPPAAGGEPVASVELERTNLADEIVPLRIDVVRLARDAGDVARLDFSISNLSSSAAFSFTDVLGFCGSRFSVCEVSLVDLGENLRYLTLLDANGVCVCSTFEAVGETIEPGDTHSYQVTYAAPPASTTIVDVQFPAFGVLTGVPVGDS